MWNIEYNQCFNMMEDINTRQKVDSIGISSPRMHLKNLVSALKTIGKNGYILISYPPNVEAEIKVFSTQQAHDVESTSYWRRCDVITLHRCHFDVICPLGMLLPRICTLQHFWQCFSHFGQIDWMSEMMTDLSSLCVVDNDDM